MIWAPRDASSWTMAAPIPDVPPYIVNETDQPFVSY